MMLIFIFDQVLLEALSRCVGVLTASSKPDDMAVQVNVKICPLLQMIPVLLADVSFFCRF